MKEKKKRYFCDIVNEVIERTWLIMVIFIVLLIICVVEYFGVISTPRNQQRINSYDIKDYSILNGAVFDATMNGSIDMSIIKSRVPKYQISGDENQITLILENVNEYSIPLTLKCTFDEELNLISADKNYNSAKEYSNARIGEIIDRHIVSTVLCILFIIVIIEVIYLKSCSKKQNEKY